MNIKPTDFFKQRWRYVNRHFGSSNHERTPGGGGGLQIFCVALPLGYLIFLYAMCTLYIFVFADGYMMNQKGYSVTFPANYGLGIP